MSNNNVTHLRPTNDIVSTLRTWADDFEAGRDELPAAIIMIAISRNAEQVPDTYYAGAPLGRYEEAGVLETCKLLTLDIINVTDTPR